MEGRYLRGDIECLTLSKKKRWCHAPRSFLVACIAMKYMIIKAIKCMTALKRDLSPIGIGLEIEPDHGPYA
jgi:hypothetical protein